MEEWLTKIIADSPWIGITLFLLWRIFSRDNKELEAYKEGSAGAKEMAQALASLSASVESSTAVTHALHTDLRGWLGNKQ